MIPGDQWETTAPNLFIIGAAKAGTTSLHAYLNGHRNVFMSEVKEPHFYSLVRPVHEQRAIMGHVVSDPASYRRLFARAAGHAVVGESSPSYLWEEGTAERLKMAHPDARLVSILRDPVERAFSHYLMDIRLGVQTLSFAAALEEDAQRPAKGWGVSHLYLELGFYGEQLERYYRHFAPEQVLVLTFDELISDPRQTMSTLLEFVGLDGADAYRLDLSGAHNSFAEPRGELARRMLGSAGVRDLGRLVPRPLRRLVRRRLLERRDAPKPVLPDDLAGPLRDIYRDDTERLEGLLGRPVPWGRR